MWCCTRTRFSSRSDLIISAGDQGIYDRSNLWLSMFRKLGRILDYKGRCFTKRIGAFPVTFATSTALGSLLIALFLSALWDFTHPLDRCIHVSAYLDLPRSARVAFPCPCHLVREQSPEQPIRSNTVRPALTLPRYPACYWIVI